MASQTIVETLHQKKSKFEIVKRSKIFRSEYFVKKDGEVISYNFKSQEEAVEWARYK